MKRLVCVITLISLGVVSMAQPANDLVEKVKAKLDKVQNYQAKGKMKTNVIFIKAPIADIKVFYKTPDKLKVVNESGISFIPKGSVNINLNNILLGSGKYDVIDGGRQGDLWVIKLLPRDENAEVILSTLYIDEKNLLVRKAKSTTRESGTFELDMSYGKYAEYGLPDKVIFSFDTKEYKLPKGVTFDYDNGGKKETEKDKMKNRKGKVELTYSEYIINKGIDDAVFK